MLHIAQDPTLDFHQVKPDSLLLSYLVGPGVKVTANLASTFDPLSSRPILHGYGAHESFPAGNEGLLEYNNYSEKSIRSSLRDRFDKSEIYPAMTFECHIGMTLFRWIAIRLERKERKKGV
jgi:hypothetical protein